MNESQFLPVSKIKLSATASRSRADSSSSDEESSSETSLPSLPAMFRNALVPVVAVVQEI